MNTKKLPIVIIGAGPVGLVTAAYMKKNNLPFILFEMGKTVGWNINTWSHVSVFSQWKYNIDLVAKELLEKQGITLPDEEDIAIGEEIIEKYLKPLSNIDGLRENIFFNSKVVSIGRKELDKMKTEGRENLPFSVRVENSAGIKTYNARAIIDASGTWHNPNPIGSGGLFAVGEIENKQKIFYGMPDIEGKKEDVFSNKSVLVVGAGHSAIGSVLALHRLQKSAQQTKIHWLLREKDVSSVYGGKEEDGFEARGALGIEIERLVESGNITIHTPVFIDEIKETSTGMDIIGTKYDLPYSVNNIDVIIGSTGSRPDFSFLREIRFDADAAIECVPELAELIDPNIHSCGTVRPHGEAQLRQREKDFYIVGMKSYGRAPTFLMATGYEQVRSIVAHLMGDEEAARDVRLVLPETGVCSTGIEGEECCGIPAIDKDNESNSCSSGSCGSDSSPSQSSCCSV